MKNILKKFWQWLVKSSQDASKTALTVKGFLYGLIPAILLISNAMNIKLDSVVLTQIIDGISTAIVYIGGTITSLVLICGLVRKIGMTITGDNDVVASWNN